MSNIHYASLTPDERVNLRLAALARGDFKEAQTLLVTAGKSTVTMLNLATQMRLDTIHDAGAVARMVLIGPIERIEMLTRFLRPTPLWSNDIDETKLSRPSLAAQYIGGVVNKAAWDYLNDISLEVDTLDRTFDIGDAVSVAAKEAVEAMLAIVLVDSYILARSLLVGIHRWCEMVSVNTSDFLAYSCEDLLDQLDRMRPDVESAHGRFVDSRHIESRESAEHLNFVIDDLDRIDEGCASALAAVFQEHLPSLG